MSAHVTEHFLDRERLFKAAASKLDEGVIVCDNRRVILYANPSVSALTGFSSEVLVGKALSFIVAPKYRKRYVSQIALALRDKKHWSGRMILHATSAAQIIADGELSMFRERGGQQETILCVLKRTHAPSSVQAAHSPAGDVLPVLNSMPEAVCVAESSGKITYCNAALPALIGWKEAEILSHPDPFAWMENEERAKFFRAFRAARRGSAQSNVRVVWTSRDERKLSMSVSLTPIRGAAKRLVIVASDVSNMEFVHQLRRAEERLLIVSSDLHRKTISLNALLVIQRLVLENAHISKIFKEIVVGVQKLVEHDLGGIYLVNADRTLLRAEIITRNTAFAKRVMKLPLPYGEGIVGLAASTGMTMIVNDAQMDPRAVYPSGKRPPCEHVIVVPLKVRSSVFGVLAIARNADPEFVEDEASLIQSFADAATVALQNERLFAELHKNDSAALSSREAANAGIIPDPPVRS